MLTKGPVRDVRASGTSRSRTVTPGGTQSDLPPGAGRGQQRGCRRVLPPPGALHPLPAGRTVRANWTPGFHVNTEPSRAHDAGSGCLLGVRVLRPLSRRPRERLAFLLRSLAWLSPSREKTSFRRRFLGRGDVVADGMTGPLLRQDLAAQVPLRPWPREEGPSATPCPPPQGSGSRLLTSLEHHQPPLRSAPGRPTGDSAPDPTRPFPADYALRRVQKLPCSRGKRVLLCL